MVKYSENLWDLHRFDELLWDFVRYHEILGDVMRFGQIQYLTRIGNVKKILWYMVIYGEILWDSVRYSEIWQDVVRFYEIQWDMVTFASKYGHRSAILDNIKMSKSQDQTKPQSSLIMYFMQKSHLL